MKAQELSAIDGQLAELIGTAREADNRAKAILDTVYDLKAVNPSTASAEDGKSLANLMESIREEGHNIEKALLSIS